MGDTTDDLIDLAQPDHDRTPTNARWTSSSRPARPSRCTLMAMALHTLGVDAVSLTGAQAGLRTDSVHQRARILSIEPDRIRREVSPRPRRYRLRLPGHHRGVRGHDPRARHLRPHGSRPGRGARSPLRALHGRRRRVHRRPPRRAGRPAAPRDFLRRDAGAGQPRRQSHAAASRRDRVVLQRADLRRVQLQGDARHPDPRRHQYGVIQPRTRHPSRPGRRQDHHARRAGPARHRRLRLRAARRQPHLGRRHRPERLRRRQHRPDLHSVQGRPRAARSASSSRSRRQIHAARDASRTIRSAR